MVWQIEFDPRTDKDFKGIEKVDRARIFNFLKERVAILDDVRSIGEPLSGPELGKFWKYRVGDYRIICDIQDVKVTVLVVRVGHRREVYRKS